MKIKWIWMPFATILLLTGCTFGQSVEDQVATVINDMNEAEKGYVEAQTKLFSLEEAEQITFEQTVNLSRVEKDQVQQQVENLISSIEKRIDTFEEEKEAMNEAKSHLSKMKTLVKGNDTSVKESLQLLQQVLADRYKTHDDIALHYEQLINEQRILYEALSDETIDLVQLEVMIHEVNTLREKVDESIHRFNDKTKEVNKVKQNFFDSVK